MKQVCCTIADRIMKHLNSYVHGVNIIVGVGCSWVFYHAPGYFWVGTLMAFVPILCWLISFILPKRFWLGEPSSKERPTLFWIHGMVMLLLWHWSLSDFVLLEDHLLPLYIVFIVPIVMVSLYRAKDEFRLNMPGGIKQLFFVLIMVAFHVTCILVVLNCTLDLKKSIVKNVRVYEKVKKNYLIPDYTIYVNSISSDSFDEEFSVSLQGFADVNIGDTVSLQIHTGFLKFKWCMLNDPKLLP